LKVVFQVLVNRICSCTQQWLHLQLQRKRNTFQIKLFDLTHFLQPTTNASVETD